MILHTLNASPTSAAYMDCLRFAAPGDAVLLMGNGVYAALAASEAYAALSRTGASLYMLSDDAEAAGITLTGSALRPLDMAGFVKLTERYQRQQAWY